MQLGEPHNLQLWSDHELTIVQRLQAHASISLVRLSLTAWRAGVGILFFLEHNLAERGASVTGAKSLVLLGYLGLDEILVLLTRFFLFELVVWSFLVANLFPTPPDPVPTVVKIRLMLELE